MSFLKTTMNMLATEDPFPNILEMHLQHTYLALELNIPYTPVSNKLIVVRWGKETKNKTKQKKNKKKSEGCCHH